MQYVSLDKIFLFLLSPSGIMVGVNIIQHNTVNLCIFLVQ